MSGGGGSDKKKTDTKTPATTTPTPSVPAQTFQPMLPGFQNMLAEQLYAGYGSGGGSVPDFATMLASLYQPMNLGSSPAAPKPNKPPAPSKPIPPAPSKPIPPASDIGGLNRSSRRVDDRTGVYRPGYK